MSMRWVLGASLAITAGAAVMVERDRGFVPEARAMTPISPPAASAPPGDHRAAVLALLGGDTSIEGLPRTSPAGAFVTAPDVPVSTKPAEVRMGSGKGSPEFWVARVKPGRMMFEIDGVSPELAREALQLGAAKLPIKVKFVTRIGDA